MSAYVCASVSVQSNYIELSGKKEKKRKTTISSKLVVLSYAMVQSAIARSLSFSFAHWVRTNSNSELKQNSVVVE